MSASLLAYFALTYLVAWTFWFGAGLWLGAMYFFARMPRPEPAPSEPSVART